MSHSHSCVDANGATVQLSAGMLVVAFEEDEDNGQRDNLVASGIVEREEQLVKKAYPEYVEYSKVTKRMIPYLF